MLRKVLTGTILGLVLFVLGSATMGRLLEHQSGQYQDLIDLYIPLEEKIDEMHLLLLQQQSVADRAARDDAAEIAELRYESDRFGEALSAAFTVCFVMLDPSGDASPDVGELRTALEPIHRKFLEHSRRLADFFEHLPAGASEDATEIRRRAQRLTDEASALQDSMAGFEETLGSYYEHALARASAVRTSVRRLFVVLVASAVVLGALANVYFYRSLLPLQSMVEAVRAVTLGRYQVRVSAEGGDEVAFLAGEFNAMTEALGEQRRAIEASHREKLQLERLVRQSEKLSAVGELALGIAHEVRNPLSTIQMTLDALGKRQDLTRVESERIALGLHEVDRLEGLVSSLLDYGRPSTPKIDAVDIGALIERSLELVQTESSRCDVEVSAEAVVRELPVIQADGNQIIQVLVNLLLNAIQASPAGGEVRVEASVDGGVQDGESVAIRVVDQGAGIDSQELQRIFTPFFTTRRDGTGLGLPVARKIAEAHGGRLTVDSAPGRGTTATLSLPLRSVGLEAS